MSRHPEQFKLSERDVQKQVKDFLEYHGWRCFRWNVGVAQNQQGVVTRYGEKGMADLMFVYYDELDGRPGAGFILWIETKREGASLRPEQVTWQIKETRRGALIVTVAEFDEFRRWYQTQFSWLRPAQGRLTLPVAE